MTRMPRTMEGEAVDRKTLGAGERRKSTNISRQSTSYVLVQKLRFEPWQNSFH